LPSETIEADAIFLGATSIDYSGYPDCRPEFLQAFQHMANLATKRGITGHRLTLETPLLHLSKQEIIQRGQKLKVPFESTWSCYRGGRYACGRCDSCQLRLQGFQKAKIADPLKYEYTPDWYMMKK